MIGTYTLNKRTKSFRGKNVHNSENCPWEFFEAKKNHKKIRQKFRERPTPFSFGCKVLLWIAHLGLAKFPPKTPWGLRYWRSNFEIFPNIPQKWGVPHPQILDFSKATMETYNSFQFGFPIPRNV